MTEKFNEVEKMVNEETTFRASITKKYPDGRILTYEITRSKNERVAEEKSIKEQDEKYYNAIHSKSTMDDIFESFKEFESCLNWN